MLADSLSPAAPISAKTDTIPKQFAHDPPPNKQLRQMFDNARSVTNAARTTSQKCRDYYDGPEQLKSETRRILRMRGQPPIYTNRVRPAIDGILGVLDAGAVDPRAYPRNPQDQDASDVATKALRYIADVNNFQATKLDVAENDLIEGVGAAIFEWDGKTITATQIRFEEFFYDPYSRRIDFKDATYLGIAKWMDLSKVQATWKEALDAIGDPLSGGMSAVDSTWQDRPNNALPWVDRQRQRLMVVELYYQEAGQWMRCVYCAAGVLEHDVSPYKNMITGETRCPIEAVTCYVDRENRRYGRVLDMIPIQDEVNARRSRLLHLANSRQIQQSDPKAAPVDSKTARDEAAKPDGVIPAGWQLVPTQDLAAGQQLLLAESKSEIERMGPTPAVLGRQGEAAQSGRARLVLQQAGMTELARVLGHIEDWENRSYRQMWLLAQQFWTGPVWVRVTDETRAPQFLQVNEPAVDDAGQPVLATDPQTGMPQMKPMTGPDGQPVAGPDGQPQMQPQQQINNRIAEMDMDIIIDSVPDTANLAQEVWSDLLELAKIVPIGSPQFMIAIEMSPLPDKTSIIERIKAYSAQQAQEQQDPAAEQTQQVQMEGAMADIANTQADTLKKEADVAKIHFEMGQASVPEVPEEPPQQAAP